MNFISPVRTRAPADAEPVLTMALAHIWRSKITDKCAEAERHVLRLERAGGGTCPARASLSQKMESLAQILTGGACALRARKIRPLLRRLRALLDLRSELVHSTLSLTESKGETVAVLRHAANEARTILSLADLKVRHSEFSQIANSLRQEADRI